MNAPASEGWEAVGDLAEVPEGGCVSSLLGEQEIALVRIDGHVYALSNWCTHAEARLSDGCLSGHAIECPLHGGRFDVRTGQALCEPATENVRVYPVRVVGTQIFAKER